MPTKSAYWIYLLINRLAHWLIKGALLLTLCLAFFGDGIGFGTLLTLVGISLSGSLLSVASYGFLFLTTQATLPGLPVDMNLE